MKSGHLSQITIYLLYLLLAVFLQENMTKVMTSYCQNDVLLLVCYRPVNVELSLAHIRQLALMIIIHELIMSKFVTICVKLSHTLAGPQHITTLFISRRSLFCVNCLRNSILPPLLMQTAAK